MKRLIPIAVLFLLGSGYTPAQTNAIDLVKDINPNGSSYPYNFTISGNKMYFVADNGTTDRELWVTDGSAAGTQLVKDINPNGSSQPGYLTLYLGKLYFSADDDTNGKELWVTDGTASGTEMVKDIYPGGSASPSNHIVCNGKLYFVADDGTNGYELWVTDGSAAGTQMVKDINPNGDADIMKLTVCNNKLYFVANDGTNGSELWTTDGSVSGTQLVKDINPSGDADVFSPTAYNNKLYFSADDGTNGVQLWVTDGTTVGTQIRAPQIFNPAVAFIGGELVPFDNSLYFSAEYNSSIAAELYKLTTADSSTAIKSVNKNLLTIFPNPSPGLFTIHSDIQLSATIEVFNLLGQKIFSKKATALTNSAIDLSQQPKGSYMVKITADSQVYTRNVLLE